MQIKPQHKVKGTILKNLKRFVAKRKNEQYFEQVAKAVGFDKTSLILPSTWYSVEKCIALEELVAKEFKMTLEEFVIQSAEYILEEDLNGVYKFFIRAGGPKLVLAKLPQLSTAYTNFSSIEIKTNEDGNFILALKTPESVKDWMRYSFIGGFSGILKVLKRPILDVKNLGEVTITEKGERYTLVDYQVLY